MKQLFASTLAAGLFSAATITALADDSTNTVVQAKPKANYQPFSLGAEIGTTGPGGIGSWRFTDHLGVSGGMDYLSYTINNRKIQNASYSGNLRLQSEFATLDYFPSKTSSFHISAGVLLNQIQVSASSPNTTIGTYTGPLGLSIQYQPVDPYLAIGGNLYFDSGHHVSLSGSLGAAYFGNSRITLSSTEPANNDVINETSKIQKYANDLRVFPVVKIALNISF